MEVTKEEILNNAKYLFKKPKINGLYFLIWANEIVYVGSSNDVHKRLATHKKHPVQKYNKYAIIETREKGLALNRMERDIIREWKPIYNKNANPDYHDGSKPIWFAYISQDKTIAEIAREVDIEFGKVNQIIKGKRKKRDGLYEKVERYFIK